jgi:hypothetical protein
VPRQVEHHELRIEREVHRETVQVGTPQAGPASPASPVERPAPRLQPVPPARLVEIIERITGHPPAVERMAERAPVPRPEAQTVLAPTLAAPARREVPPAARRPAAPRLPEAAVPAPVHVHIERIEVRSAPAKPRAVPRAQPRTDPAPSLQAFLAGKAGER